MEEEDYPMDALICEEIAYGLYCSRIRDHSKGVDGVGEIHSATFF